jgi:hypothetical protein
MHRLHALRLALLCCALVAVLAACGSSSNVQPNYGSLGNEICGKFTDATKANPSPAARLKAVQTALAGLEALNPPQSVESVYIRFLYNFRAAFNILKTNQQTIARLAKRLETHPGDKVAARRYAAIAARIKSHLTPAANDAYRLGMSRCRAALGG